MNAVIIGAGGIGSHFCRVLDKLMRHSQLRGDGIQVPTEEAMQWSVYDFDVVERKNLKHQDFDYREIGLPKSLIMAKRYDFAGAPVKFTEDHLGDFDFFVICADNAAVRKIVYEHCKTAGKPFIDMRCEGDMIAVYTHKCELDELLDSLGEDKDSEEGKSCQLAVDTAAQRIQMGNFAVVPIGAQVLLHMVRNEPFPKKVVRTVA